MHRLTGERVGFLCNLLSWKEIEDVGSCHCKLAVFADMFHSLTLINLLSIQERKKKHGWESVKSCCSTDKVLFLFVRAHHQLIFNSTPV